MVLYTVHFISKDEVAIILCSIRLQKAEIYRTWLTVGGNLNKYPHSVSMPTSYISTVKCLISSVIYTPNIKLCGKDIKENVNTPMDTF